jgi:hypothetical protein
MSSTWSGPAAGNEAGRPESYAAGSAGAPWTGTSLWQAFVGGTGRVEALERYGTLAARILMSQIFLISGVMKIIN